MPKAKKTTKVSAKQQARNQAAVKKRLMIYSAVVFVVLLILGFVGYQMYNKNKADAATLTYLGATPAVNVLDGAPVKGGMCSRSYDPSILRGKDKVSLQAQLTTTSGKVNQLGVYYQGFIAYGSRDQVANMRKFGPVNGYGSGTMSTKIKVTKGYYWVGGAGATSGGKYYQNIKANYVPLKLSATSGALGAQTGTGPETYVIFGYANKMYEPGAVEVLEQSSPIQLSKIRSC